MIEGSSGPTETMPGLKLTATSTMAATASAPVVA
jgi:hypothetical protein